MAENVNTIIGKGARIDGMVEIQGHLRIDGYVKGTVKCDEALTIGPQGKVEADVNTKTVVVSGEIKGNITADERLELQAKSVVTGDIRTKSLVVEQGAILHGSCLMKDNIPPKSSDNKENK
ncbi:MAG: polymer-forming cytoskeletal protein [candidate division Zixibacteria bacterium]|jgi:cytoskeletal protein CcmA (bactofilin family)|nr:polymer-forming cytoskeletal protein [candidate division Zixibacteria bacterium]